MAAKDNVQLMSPDRTKRALARIARQILEDTGGSKHIIVFGIDERGEKLAGLLSNELEKIFSSPVPFYRVAVKEKKEDSQKTDADITGKHVVIFDDVIFSGKTMYKAFKQVMRLGDPEQVKLAALIDRGHRVYPIEAQYVGLVSPTKLDEHVHCVFNKEEPGGVLLSMNGEYS